MKKLWIHGISGRMGQVLSQLAQAHSGYQLLGGSALDHCLIAKDQDFLTAPLTDGRWLEADVIIDFSAPEGTRALLKQLSSKPKDGQAVLIATTGLDQDVVGEFQSLATAHKLRLLFAANTSIGVLVMTQLARKAAKILAPMGFDLELMETHHRYKKDSPSGTALFIADQVARTIDAQVVTARTGARAPNELGVVAMRGGQVFGEHSLRFMGDLEELSLSHTALSRDLFGKGALSLGLWLMSKQPGIYDLMDVELDELSQIS